MRPHQSEPGLKGLHNMDTYRGSWGRTWPHGSHLFKPTLAPQSDIAFFAERFPQKMLGTDYGYPMCVISEC